MNDHDIGVKFRAEIENLVKQSQTALTDAILSTDTRPTLAPDAEKVSQDLTGRLPQSGCGARLCPAFSNWRTRNTDVEEFTHVVVEPGQSLL